MLQPVPEEMDQQVHNREFIRCILGTCLGHACFILQKYKLIGLLIPAFILWYLLLLIKVIFRQIVQRKDQHQPLTGPI